MVPEALMIAMSLPSSLQAAVSAGLAVADEKIQPIEWVSATAK